MTRFLMGRDINKVHLKNRGLIKISGMDACSFLQGLLTNDMEKVSQNSSIYAAFLTPQGRFSHDLFISKFDSHFLLDTELSRIPELLKKLNLYKLRTDVVLEDISAQYSIWALWGETVFADFKMEPRTGNSKLYEGGIIYVDPRLMELGFRVIVPHASEHEPPADPNPLEHHPHSEEDRTFSLYAGRSSLKNLTTYPEPPAWMLAHLDASYEDYELLRLSLGVPDSSVDMIPEKSVPLECNLDQLNAISWDKGCYLGQELIARATHRGLIRKRLLPVHIDGAPVSPGTELYMGDKKVGSMRSSYKNRGIALLRLEVLKVANPILKTKDGRTVLNPHVPNWMELEGRIPEP